MQTNRVHFHVIKSTRRGMAPLELVMSLPFLLAIAAIIFSIGVASLGKSTAAIDARLYVWQRRSNPVQNSKQLEKQSHTETFALSLFSPVGQLSGELPGEVYGEYENTMHIAPWLKPAAHARSGASVLTSSWDYEEVEFGKYPDLPVLTKMGGLSELEKRAVDKLQELLSYFKRF